MLGYWSLGTAMDLTSGRQGITQSFDAEAPLKVASLKTENIKVDLIYLQYFLFVFYFAIIFSNFDYIRSIKRW
jgi:hypothetical protein